MTEAEYTAALKRRLVMLRKAKGMTQLQMATALGVQKDAYKKWENLEGRQFPPHLYERLALVTDQSLDFIVTGRGFKQPRSRTAA